MTTRYRVEYALKSHRRDQLIEWIKGLLAVPFVLHSQPTSIYPSSSSSSPPPPPPIESTAPHKRYLEVFHDVELLITDHIAHQDSPTPRSKLKMLVPSVGSFFTPLPLADAFAYHDRGSHISARRFVAPSFNDVRKILNTAQVMGIARAPPPSPTVPRLGLVTFDGDVTLYDDGGSLEAGDAVIPLLLDLLRRGTKVGIVTAAGYSETSRYEARLLGLLQATAADASLTPEQKASLVVMGGESNYLFQYDQASVDPDAGAYLTPVPSHLWASPAMLAWPQSSIAALLSLAESTLQSLIAHLRLPASIIRKPLAIGIVPSSPSVQLTREQLEETVLTLHTVLSASPLADEIPFCAFNGGRDVFVDIGDKSLGVAACQRFFGGVEGGRTLHVGDQFLSGGGNDFKARLVCATIWVAGWEETVGVLGEVGSVMGRDGGEGKGDR